MLEKIEKAGGSIDSAAQKCLQKSADIMQTELKSSMQKSNVDSALIARMPAPETKKSGNRYSAKVGFPSTSYNPKHLSDYHKAIFLNYGTPNRTMHGKIQDGGKVNLGFIQRAKKNAKSKIKKQQEETLNEILKEI